MPKMPMKDDWIDFRSTSLYKDTLSETAEAFIALYRVSKPHKRVYRTATQQLVQAPMEYDGGDRRYLRARWRLPNYIYGTKAHGEHPFTKKKTKELIEKAIKIGLQNNVSHKRLVEVITYIIDSRQDTVLMTNGHQNKVSGFIKASGDGFIERYLPTSTILIDRLNGDKVTEVGIRTIQMTQQKIWEDAIQSLYS
jgi:hypothetical protein